MSFQDVRLVIFLTISVNRLWKSPRGAFSVIVLRRLSAGCLIFGQVVLKMTHTRRVVEGISRMDRGDRNPSMETLERLALALDEVPAELLNFEERVTQR
jgi:hypothetical protein